MKKRKTQQHPWVLPYLTVSDVHRMSDFYISAFNFSLCDIITNDDGIADHADMYYHDIYIMLALEGTLSPDMKAPIHSNTSPSMLLYVYCPNVDELYKNALAMGAENILPPENTYWSDRMCQLKDPDGYIWQFASFIN